MFQVNSREERYDYLIGLLEKYEMLYYSSGMANQPIEQLAVASSTAYTFNGAELITAFNNNPQINAFAADTPTKSAPTSPGP